MKKLAYLTAVAGMLAASAWYAIGQNASPIVPPLDNGKTSFVQIGPDAKLTVYAAKIMQVAGPTFYTRALWGDVFIRIILKTNDKSALVKRFGGKIVATDISQGDIISFEGKLESGDAYLVTTATWLKDWSIQTAEGDVSGTISSVDTPNNSFVLSSNERGVINVTNNNGGVWKGARNIQFSEIKTGDRVTSASGVYNDANKTFAADTVKIFIDKTIFYPRNFAGIIISLANTVLPTEITVTSEGKEYTLVLDAKTIVLNNLRSPIALARFVKGDHIRFYGAIQELEPSKIKVEVLRNLDL